MQLSSSDLPPRRTCLALGVGHKNKTGNIFTEWILLGPLIFKTCRNTPRVWLTGFAQRAFRTGPVWQRREQNVFSMHHTAWPKCFERNVQEIEEKQKLPALFQLKAFWAAKTPWIWSPWIQRIQLSIFEELFFSSWKKTTPPDYQLHSEYRLNNCSSEPQDTFMQESSVDFW